MYVSIYVCTCMYVCACVYVCLCVYMCTCPHTVAFPILFLWTQVCSTRCPWFPHTGLWRGLCRNPSSAGQSKCKVLTREEGRRGHWSLPLGRAGLPFPSHHGSLWWVLGESGYTFHECRGPLLFTHLCLSQ